MVWSGTLSGGEAANAVMMRREKPRNERGDMTQGSVIPRLSER